MISAAVSVAAFRFEFTMMREMSAKGGRACDARAFRSSWRKMSWGQVVGMLSRKFSQRGKVRVAGPLVVKASGSEEVKLRSVIHVSIHLAVVELDGADRLFGTVPLDAIRSQASVGAMTTVLIEP